MNGEFYTYPGEYYDALMTEVDYRAWGRFVTGSVERFAERKINTVLDLACGTGSLTEVLAQLGYDMTALDFSPEMLARAAPRLSHYRDPDVLLLQGDMRSFELNDTVDCTVCALDSLNYLTGRGDLVKCFKRVSLFMNPGGLFLFDVDTPYKFREVYGMRDYVLESDGLLCAWKNYYDEEKGLCDFELSFFEERPDGSYIRTDEFEQERCYTRRMIENALKKADFELCGVFSGDPFDSFADATEADERWMVAARKRSK